VKTKRAAKTKSKLPPRRPATAQERPDPNVYPRGWDRAKIQALIDHYENQTDDEAIAEMEAAFLEETKHNSKRPRQSRHRGPVGYQRITAGGDAGLVPAVSLPVGRRAPSPGANHGERSKSKNR
jgi:hypothetical protein